jgi:hypothetical protein
MLSTAKASAPRLIVEYVTEKSFVLMRPLTHRPFLVHI